MDGKSLGLFSIVACGLLNASAIPETSSYISPERFLLESGLQCEQKEDYRVCHKRDVDTSRFVLTREYEDSPLEEVLIGQKLQSGESSVCFVLGFTNRGLTESGYQWDSIPDHYFSHHDLDCTPEERVIKQLSGFSSNSSLQGQSRRIYQLLEDSGYSADF